MFNQFFGYTLNICRSHIFLDLKGFRFFDGTLRLSGSGLAQLKYRRRKPGRYITVFREGHFLHADFARL